MQVQRTRVIGSSRRSPARTPSPRFSDIPATSVPPVPFRDPRTSPAISPRSPTVPPQLPFLVPITRDRPRSSLSRPATDNQRPSSHLVLPVPRQAPYPSLLQQDWIRSGRTTPLQPRPATPHIQFQPSDLTGQITQEHQYSAYGSYGDVWVGNWRNGAETTKVAIKKLRPRDEAGRRKLNSRLHREIEVWKRLVHHNVVPLLGITTDVGPYTSMGMVSPWMDNGDLNKYLERTTTLTVSDRFGLLCDVAAGLGYLHSKSVIHGDLTGGNILIDGNGIARLVDFGLSTIKAEFEGTSYDSSTVGGAIRWRAPELLSISEHDMPSLTAECDIYSYGSVIVQVLSGKIPYHNFRSEFQVAAARSRRIQPQRPQEVWVADTHWEFMQRCLDQLPRARPSIEEVKDQIGAFHRECVAVRSIVQQIPTLSSSPARFNHHRSSVISSTDGYETDSEAPRVLTPSADSSGWLSGQEGGTRHMVFSQRPSTLSVVNTVRSQRETAAPTIRTINSQTISDQRFRPSITREVFSLATATYSGIHNVDVDDPDVILYPRTTAVHDSERCL